MLELVTELDAMLAGGKQLGQGVIDNARWKLGAWAHRPLDIAFLHAALGPVWSVLDSGSESSQFVKPSALLATAEQQAKRSGWLGDVGRFDIETATKLLHVGGRGMSETVIGDLYTADPTTRAYLLVQIRERGLLSNLCSAVGWEDIKQLHDSLASGFPELRHDLQSYFVGKGKYGPSPASEWENHESSLHSVVARLGTPGRVMNFVLDLATFGFNSSYAEAIDDRSNGASSESEAHRAKIHAAARTAAIAVVSTITGGLAEGAISGRAGVSTARAIAGGAAGGSVGGAYSLLTSDAYNNYIAGTQSGTSSPQAYVETILMGGAGGAALAGVVRGLSRDAGAYVREAGAIGTETLTSTPHTTGEGWDYARAEMIAGRVPAPESLPNTAGNKHGLQRLADIHADETIPASIREEFMHEFGERLRGLKEPPENLFNTLNEIVYSTEGRVKFQRKGTKISNVAYVRDVLGGLRRLVSLRALCQEGMISEAFYKRARAASTSELPPYERLRWNNGAQEVVEMIKSGAVEFDPNRDMLPSAVIEGRAPGDSGWFFAGADADVSNVGQAQSQLAIGGAYLDGYVVLDLPAEMALPDPQTGHTGASRPTALDLTLDPLGKLNPDTSEPVGRTNPQTPGQVSAREVVLPPTPLSAMSKRTYVRAGGS
jgi:hypothetical protein